MRFARRLLHHVGAPRASHLLAIRAHRAAPLDPRAGMVWAHYLAGERGPYAALEYLRAFPVDAAEGEQQADLRLVRAGLLVDLRDFEAEVLTDRVEDGEVVVETDDLEVGGAVVGGDEVARGDPGESLSEDRSGMRARAIAQTREGVAKAAGVAGREELVGGEGGLEAPDVSLAGREDGGPVPDRFVSEAGVELACAPREAEVGGAGQLAGGRGRAARGHLSG